MKIAVRQCDITPLRPCWQGGYVQRSQVYEHVHDPITATVLALTLNDKKMIWVSLDVSGVRADLARQILDKTAAKGVTLEPEEIILGATHTHSGPLVGSYYDRPADPEYCDLLVDRVSSAIAEAYRDPGIEVKARYSKVMIDGLYSNRNDRNKQSDKMVHLLGFFEQGQLSALYCTLAHHCTVLGPNFMDLSADLFGEIRRLLQKQFAVPVLMAQGNAGDMGNKQYRQSNLFDEVERQAAAIVDQIRKKQTPWETLQLTEIQCRTVVYHAVYDIDAESFAQKKADFEKQLETETDFDTVKLLVTGIQSFERKIAAGSRHVERKMPAWIYTFGDLQIVAVPGELGSILGMRIKAASSAKVCLVWGYVDPCDLGYMIEKEAYEGFSQESNVTDYPAGIPDAYAAAIIEALQ